MIKYMKKGEGEKKGKKKEKSFRESGPTEKKRRKEEKSPLFSLFIYLTSNNSFQYSKISCDIMPYHFFSCINPFNISY